MSKRFPSDNFRVIFVEPENSGNIGSIARLMENFSLKELILINPSVDIDDTAKAFATHGLSVLNNAKIFSRIDDAICDSDLVIGTTAIAGGDYNPLRTCLSAHEIDKLALPGKCRVSLIFGRESRGLSNEELNHCDIILTIPASPSYTTLNVSHAAAIIFYELYKYYSKKAFQKNRLAKSREKELMIKYFNLVLSNINYPPNKSHVAQRIFRNLIGRAVITGREIYTLMGIFRRLSMHSKADSKA